MESYTTVKIKYFKGKKGGSSGGGQTITNTPDNLRSKDTVEAILGICEGPIFGLKDGAKSFYIGDTQLQNDNGDYNFKTFQLNLFPGDDPADEVIPTLGGTSSNSAVNLTLAYNTPVTRQTSTGLIDFIDVRIIFNRLFSSTTSGTFNTTAKLRIEYKALSSGTWLKAFGADLSITGKTTSAYVKEFRIAVDQIGEPYEIRITKLSSENTTSFFADMSWESFQETIAGSRAYDNTAVVQLTGEASDQFSSIPSWSGIYKGLLVRVPYNYSPETREYTGMWDGTFQVAWTNNPAWCLYDFVMNDRYGIASYYPEVNLDRYDVYEAAQWCDELVPDGAGGTQPRYTFNAYLTEARSGKELARYIAGSFNATFYDDLNGTAYLRVDKDDDGCNIFTKENVYDGEFEYSYTDITSRYNDITVTFKNPELNWSEDRRRIFDDELIARNGRVPLDFIAVGCTNAHQAKRMAYGRLLTANTETCMVRFRTNRLGQFVNPFDVILVCDPDMGYGVSGRVKAVTNSGATVTLRTPVYLEAGIAYNIEFVLSDGTRHRTTIIDSVKGYNYSLNITAPLDEELVPEHTVFTLEHDELLGLPRPFRVMKVEETDGNPDDFTIEAVNINRNKWYDTDNLTDSGVVDYSVLPNPFDPPGPTSVGLSERYVEDRKEFHITVSPTFDRGAYKYYANDHSFEVWSRLTGTSDNFVKREILFGDTLVNHPPGTYDFKILGKSYLGKTSNLNSVSTYVFDVTNPKEPPKDIDWVKINQREVYWGYENPPADFKGFIVRYHNQANRTTWYDAAQPHIGYLSATSFYTNLIPQSARVIMVKAIDDFDTESVNSAIIYRAAGDSTGVNVVERFDYHLPSPAWGGTLEGCSVESGSLKADDTGTNVYSGVASAFLYDGGDFYEATYMEMLYYDFFTVTVEGKFLIEIDFEGAGYETSIRPVESPVAPWEPVSVNQPLTPGDYEIRLRVFGGPIRGIVNEFSVVIDADDISEDIQDLNIGSGGSVRVPLTKTYTLIKIVNVIIQDDGFTDAVGYRVLDKDPILGPEIQLLDATNSPTMGLVDVQIKGY